MEHIKARSITSVIWLFVIGLIVAGGVVAVRFAQADSVPTTLPEAKQLSTSTNLGLYGGDTWDIAVDGNYVYTIATSTPNGFFYSTDSAATWQRPVGNYDYGSGSGVEVDTATGAVYVSLGGDLYKSTDHGATITQIAANAGFPLLFAQGKILAGNNNSILISADNGTSFTTITVSTPDSMGFTSFAASPTVGTFYATAYDGESGVGYLYKSTDSGATWSNVTVSVGGSAVTSFSTVGANPYDANNIVVSNDHHLWQSLDGGSTYAEVDHNCNTISTWTPAGRWYACSAYSTDQGTTWTDLDIHTNVVRGPGKVIVYNAADPAVMYGDCMSGVCKSTDSGMTWANSFRGITAVNVRAISYTNNKKIAWVSSGNGLAKTTNFDAAIPTWQYPILPCAPERCDASGIGQSIWVKPNDSNIVLVGSIGGFIYRSTDGGATWTTASHPSIDVAKFINTDTSMNLLTPSQFVSDPNNSTTVYLALSGMQVGGAWLGAVLKSVDSGATWTDLSIPSDAPANTLSVNTSGVMYVGTGASRSAIKGVYKYQGGHWSKLSGIPTDVNINSILIDPETATTVYATGTADARLGHDGFYKSTDSGATWTKKTTGLTGYYGFDAITVDKSTRPNTLYLSGRDTVWHGALLKSGDAGENWGLMYQGLRSETYNTVVFDGLVAGSQHGVFGLKTKSKFANFKMSASSVKKGRAVTFSGTLRDGVTKRGLKDKVLGLYQLNGKKWKLIGTIKTKSGGSFSTKVKPTKNTTYLVQWSPNRTDKAEYIGVSTLNLAVKIKK